MQTVSHFYSRLDSYSGSSSVGENTDEGIKNMIVQIVMTVYSVLFPILVGYIIKLLKDQKKERDANAKGTMLLLRVQLIEYHDRYTAKGTIPSYAYQNFKDMYAAYHDLGGNGMIEKMKQEVDDLDLERKQEA